MDSATPIPGSAEDRDPTRFTDPPFPTLEEAVTAFLGDYEPGEKTPYRVTIGILANREVTYKVAVKESEETDGGVLSV